MGFVWGAGQMVGAGIDDLITGRQRTTGDYLSIWAQNTIGGAQLGASVDVGLMSGGLALPASGALGAAGFDALTFGGEAQERSDFGKSQAKEAAVGAVLGPVLSKLAPAAGALVGRVPGAKRLGRWAAGKATEGVEAVARRYVRTEADDVLRKPFAQFVESATQLPGRARQALARRATQAREAIGQKLDDFTVRQEAAVQRVIANGRQSELGAVSFGAPGAPAVGRPVSRAPRINLSPMREVGRLPVMDPSVVKAALGRRSAASTDWAYQIHDHHLYPKWLGGRESGPVARIRGFEHLSDLEPQLVGFMKTRIPGLTKNSPRQIRRALRSGVTQDDITNALVDFYTTRYPDIPAENLRTILGWGIQ